MTGWKKLKQVITTRKLLKLDILAAAVFLLAMFGVNEWRTWYSLIPQHSVELVNPYLAQADDRGNTWVIDQERSRILKINSDQKAEYQLVSNSREADSFWYAEDIAAGDNGYLYVLDASWDATGSAVGREGILVYDEKGNYTETLMELVYEDEFVDKHRLFALTFRENTLYYVESLREGFSLFSVSTETGEVRQEQFYAYDNAFNLIQDYALDERAETIYALDKRGKILKAGDGELSVLYSTANDPAFEGKATFYRLALDAEDNIYVTDIRENYILRFTEGQESPDIYLDEGQVLSVTSSVQKDGSTVLGIWLDWGIRMCNLETGEEASGYAFAKTFSYRLTESAYELCSLLAGLAALWLALRVLVMLIGIPVSEIQKNGILAGVTAAVVAFVIVSQLLIQFETMYREELVNKLYIMAYMVSGMVDPESLGEIRTSEDYMEEDYRDLMEVLELAFNREESSAQEVYCNVLALENGEGFAIAYLDNSIGTYYPVDDAETEELQYIYDTGEEVRNDGKDDVTGSYIYVRVPVTTESGEVSGVIEVGSTTDVITGKIEEMKWSVMITLVLVILIVMFLFGEILSFFDMRQRYKKSESQEEKMPMHLLRVSIFVTYLAFNVASSFLPVYAAGFVTDSLGMPRELAASLPITLNLIFVGVTSLFCAGLVRRFSFRSVAAVSACVSMAGDTMLFLGQNYAFLVLGLILNGCGMGLITNSIHMFIAGNPSEEVKEEGFSVFNAGSLSGVNCGMMLGASLAGAMGQRFVFACSASAWLIVGLLFLVMGRHMHQTSSGEPREDLQKKRTFDFLKSRRVIPYLLLIQFPYVIINSFVFYYVPIYGDAMGFSESIVCLFLMLNSLCSVYLSVSITKFMSGRFREKSIYLSTVICCGALLLFGWNSSVPVLIVVLVILGIAASFGTTVRQVYFTELPAVAEYGEDSAMGIYNLMDNVGESAGPILFGSILTGANHLPGLSCFAAVSLIFNGAYGLMKRRDQRRG